MGTRLGGLDDEGPWAGTPPRPTGRGRPGRAGSAPPPPLALPPRARGNDLRVVLVTASARSRLVSGHWSRATAGLLTRDHRLEVPLDHSGAGDRLPGGAAAITVYTREICLAESAAVDPLAKPPLVFLQGGPGCEAPRPSADAGLGWLGALLEHHRVLLVDQRGTGLSTPIDRPDNKNVLEEDAIESGTDENKNDKNSEYYEKFSDFDFDDNENE